MVPGHMPQIGISKLFCINEIEKEKKTRMQGLYSKISTKERDNCYEKRPGRREGIRYLKGKLG
jgi:hypothetical protein